MSAFQSLRAWAANSTVAHVGFGFLAMGGWAVFANRHHPLPDALLAGLVQGTVSGLLTLVLKKFLEWLAARMSPTLGQAQPVQGGARRIAALIVPPLITAASILAILVSAHTLAGTPEIAATIAVPFTVSTTYAIIYNWSLWKRGRA
jgi:hypothetical protein